MLRLFLLLLALAVLVWWLRRVLRLGTRPNPPQERQAPRQLPTTVVACAHCGVHIPVEEALSHNQDFYCSQAHLQLGARQQA